MALFKIRTEYFAKLNFAKKNVKCEISSHCKYVGNTTHPKVCLDQNHPVKISTVVLGMIKMDFLMSLNYDALLPSI